MVDLQQLVRESREELEKFLVRMGLHQPGQPIANDELRDRFSDWLATNKFADEDLPLLVAYVGAFIGEYLIEGYAAAWQIQGRRLAIRLSVDPTTGIAREFEPFDVAVGVVRDKASLKDFLATLVQ